MQLSPKSSPGSRINRVLVILLVLLVLIVAAFEIWRPDESIRIDIFSTKDTPEVISSEAPTPTPESTLAPTPIPKPETFTMIWLDDTQTIAYYKDNKVFDAMGKWIAENEKPLNIRYIVQTGDLVDNGYQQKQWDSFNILRDYFYGKIPYLTVAGNHDLGVKKQDYTAFLSQPFITDLPEEQKFKGGQAVWAEFQAGGVDFLLIGAGWGADVSSANWINGVLRAHPNHVGILLVHSYITARDVLSYQGDEVRDLIVAKNPNIRLVLSGHIRGSGYLAEEFDDDGDGEPDRTVQAMLYNFQEYPRYSSGQIRILTFDTATRNIHVATYSPYTDRYYFDRHFKAQEFDLLNAF
ncbi:MAG TPA: metallophosphoesterase [Clostridia bacterium]|nr:metallophosphoesterase [Clostridia bacterium]